MKRWVAGAAIVVLAVGAGYLMIRYVAGFVLPFVLALALAVLIDPVVNRLQRHLRLPRSIAVLVSLAGIFGGVGALIFVSLSRLVRELLALSRELPLYYDEAVLLGRSLTEWFARVESALPDPVRLALRSQEMQLQDMTADWLRQLIDVVVGLFRWLPSLMIIMAVTCIATFFLSRDKQIVSGVWWRTVPRAWHRRINVAKTQLVKSMLGLLGAQLILVATTAGLITTGFFLIGGSYAVTLGIIAGILDLVPYVGPAVVIGPWAALSILRGDILFGVKLLALLTVVALVRQYLEARLIGERTGLHPLVILFSLYVGARIFGPIGLAIGPLVAIVIRTALVSGLFPGWEAEEEATP